MDASEPGTGGSGSGSGTSPSPLLLGYIAADGLAVLTFLLGMILGWYEGDARPLMFVHIAVIVLLSVGLPAILRRSRTPSA